MKKIIAFVVLISLASFTVVSQNFIGNWEVVKSKDNYNGVTNYQVYFEYDEYHVKILNAYEFPAFFDIENHTLYFVIDGVGPGSTFVKFTMLNNEMQESMLINGIWKKFGLFRKK